MFLKFLFEDARLVLHFRESVQQCVSVLIQPERSPIFPNEVSDVLQSSRPLAGYFLEQFPADQCDCSGSYRAFNLRLLRMT